MEFAREIIRKRHLSSDHLSIKIEKKDWEVFIANRRIEYSINITELLELEVPLSRLMTLERILREVEKSIPTSVGEGGRETVIASLRYNCIIYFVFNLY